MLPHEQQEFQGRLGCILSLQTRKYRRIPFSNWSVGTQPWICHMQFMGSLLCKWSIVCCLYESWYLHSLQIYPHGLLREIHIITFTSILLHIYNYIFWNILGKINHYNFYLLIPSQNKLAKVGRICWFSVFFAINFTLGDTLVRWHSLN